MRGHWRSDRAGRAVKELKVMETYKKQKIVSNTIILVSVKQQC